MIVQDLGRGVDTPAPPVPAVCGPRWLPVVPDAIPRKLADTVRGTRPSSARSRRKVGKWDKIPGDPQHGQPATWSDPATRCTFGDAFMAYESGRFGGIGYMMDATAGVIGIDLDDCVSPRTAPSHRGRWRSSPASRAPTGSAASAARGSGASAAAPCPWAAAARKIEGCSVELYADERFLVVTGQALAPRRAAARRSSQPWTRSTRG